MSSSTSRPERGGGASVRAAALTDRGRVRPINEDAVVVSAEAGLLIVADGLGGEQGGATASRLACERLPSAIQERLRGIDEDAERVSAALREAILDFGREVRRQGEASLELTGMGATVVIACIRDASAYVASLGDSRMYLYRRGRLSQLTRDHAVLALLIKAGEVTEEEARHHPSRGVVSRYRGMQYAADPDISVVPLEPTDRLLLCSDGLTGPVADTEIARTLESAVEPAAACRALVDAANAEGGPDNVSVIVADWEPGRPSARSGLQR